jgi:regulator of replication initiation timing
MAKVRGGDFEPIDRLEEKIRLLVTALDQLRADQARVSEQNERMTREVDQLRARLADAEGAMAEVGALKEERDEIRTRVADMLQQLDPLNL